MQGLYFFLSSLQRNFEPFSPDANLNVALRFGLIDLRPRSSVLGAREWSGRGHVGVAALGPGSPSASATALGPGVTVGVG